MAINVSVQSVQRWISPGYYTVDPNILIILQLGNPITFHQDYYIVLAVNKSSQFDLPGI